jgi:Uma2 family endonuclease
MNAIAVPYAIAVEPQVRRWTREEFHRMADIGFFQGQRAELLEGEVMVLSPQNPGHYTATHRLAELLHAAFGSAYYVRMQGPIELGPHSEPEPDVAVVPGSRDQYASQHPKSAALIVEISDSSLAWDRGRKASLYARAGIADYWIVNLVDRRLEVRRSPVADANADLRPRLRIADRVGATGEGQPVGSAAGELRRGRFDSVEPRLSQLDRPRPL